MTTPPSILLDLPPPPPGRTGWPWTAAPEPLGPTMPDGSPWPRISVITPSYNQGAFIEGTIRSVLLQGYPNLEYMIMDGGSSDETLEIIHTYEPWLTHWVSEKDRGQSHAINKGFARATGGILAWLNSDDMLLPGALAAVARARAKDPDAVAWVGSCYRILPDGRILRTSHPRGLDRTSLADWGNCGYFCQPSCFIAAWSLSSAGVLDEDRQYAMDVDLWLRLAAIGDIQAVPEVLSAAILHEAAKTQAHRSAMFADTIAVQIKHGYMSVAERYLSRMLERQLTSPDANVRRILTARVANALTTARKALGRRLRFLRRGRQRPLFFQTLIDEGRSRTRPREDEEATPALAPKAS